MRWDGSAGSGFTSGRPWLPMGSDVATINVEAERNDPQSMLALHRRLLALRRAEPSLAVGDWALIAADGDLLAYERHETGSRRLAVFLNLGRAELATTAPAGRVVLSTKLDRDSERVEGRLSLRPNEGVIVELASPGVFDTGLTLSYPPAVSSASPARIRILLVDDHEVVRRGLRGFLELQDDMEVVGEASDGAIAIAQADALDPDVVLMDLLMPNVDGLTAIRCHPQGAP
jgi:hypothetical protein